MRKLICLLGLVALAGCDSTPDDSAARWAFRDNCAAVARAFLRNPETFSETGGREDLAHDRGWVWFDAQNAFGMNGHFIASCSAGGRTGVVIPG